MNTIRNIFKASAVQANRLAYGAAMLFVFSVINSALSATIPCDTDLTNNLTTNYMEIDDSVVSACLDSGVGNIQGTLPNDLFLLGAGLEYESAGKTGGSNPFGISYSQTGGNLGNSGTFQLDSSFWDTFATGAIGFKFGTGNQPDEWFVYQLGSGVTFGSWDFFEFDIKGGSGLSHVNLYGKDHLSAVPIPAAAWLFGSVIVAAGVFGRRKGKS